MRVTMSTPAIGADLTKEMYDDISLHLCPLIDANRRFLQVGRIVMDQAEADEENVANPPKVRGRCDFAPTTPNTLSQKVNDANANA